MFPFRKILLSLVLFIARFKEISRRGDGIPSNIDVESTAHCSVNETEPLIDEFSTFMEEVRVMFFLRLLKVSWNIKILHNLENGEDYGIKGKDGRVGCNVKANAGYTV